LFLLIFAFVTGGFAQFGIKAGINMANQIKSFRKQDIVEGFSTDNLTGYHIGVIYELFPKRQLEQLLGADAGIFLSQKGFAYTDSTKVSGIVTQGYNEINYIEIPVNLRYRYSHKLIGAYGTFGLFGGYILTGKSANETENTSESMTFPTLLDRFDYGYCMSAGVELFRKVQLGLSWTHGLKNVMSTTAKDNRVFSINMTYLFR